jgi:hypothetical protein
LEEREAEGRPSTAVASRGPKVRGWRSPEADTEPAEELLRGAANKEQALKKSAYKKDVRRLRKRRRRVDRIRRERRAFRQGQPRRGRGLR